MNTLLVDIGNSRIKWRFARLGDAAGGSAGPPAADAALALADLPRLAAWWRSNAAEPVGAVFVSNVADEGAADAVVDAARANWPGIVVHRVASRHAQCGVVNAYRDPSQLGSDRWLTMIGAHAARPGRHVLACSFGTATTIDLLVCDDESSARATFVGGMILPGIDAMRAVLASGTARLPLARGAPVDFADATDDAIASGIMAAQAGAVDRSLRRARRYLANRRRPGDPLCLFAGGAATAVRAFLDEVAVADLVPDLVLRGLAEVARDAALADPEREGVRLASNG